MLQPETDEADETAQERKWLRQCISDALTVSGQKKSARGFLNHIGPRAGSQEEWDESIFVIINMQTSCRNLGFSSVKLPECGFFTLRAKCLQIDTWADPCHIYRRMYRYMRD